MRAIGGWTALFSVLASAAMAGAPGLEPAWTLDGFNSPESVALSVDGDFLYVSNIGGEGGVVDGDGFVSRISLDGAVVEHHWASGMDAPKGMALKDSRLYVSDITWLAVLDAADGRVLQRIEAPGSGFLNDVALAPDGRILVSDSARSRIYALEGDQLVPWREDPRLRAVNGLLPEAERLVITTMTGLLLAMDYQTGEITQLAEGLGAGDGVAPLEHGAYIATEWPGRLFHVAQGGAVSLLLDERPQNRYMNDILLVGDLLVVPRLSTGEITAYRLKP